jgi:hydrogenase-4 component B
MTIIGLFILLVLSAFVLVPVVSARWKGIMTVTIVSILAILSSSIAFQSLIGTTFEYLFRGTLVTGVIPVRIDALSGWFILIINFTFITGAFYGSHYMKAYYEQKANLSLHWICLILVQASLISICVLQNFIAFLIAWEFMALSSFILIIFEYQKRETLNAGINFLIQSHISILFLTLGFIWVSMKMSAYDFTAIAAFSSTYSLLTSALLFLCFFFGFAIKAGFVPFHTWLPYAHPVAPAHISGIMSGVIIKIGIYGILRMLLLIKSDYVVLGYIILFISILSGLYGVMLAIIQHNIKRLLAYHSIENIGIIGIGIGLGCIGIGKGNQLLTLLGFAGALLHTLNHSLFKSVLFYGAGNVYQATHSTDIERMGGLIKRLPHTAFLFLIASLAICGLPPFNGFVSEFLIYNGMFTGLHSADKIVLNAIVCGLFGLGLIGGLAMLCFTKAFGAIFLGTARHPFHDSPEEAGMGKLIPMYAGAILMLAIGVFPQYFVAAISKPLQLFTRITGNSMVVEKLPFAETLSMVGLCALVLLGVAGLIYFIRRLVTSHKPQYIDVTWGCGYVVPTSKMQYTASSFTRAYRKLAEPFLSIHKKKTDISGIFPVHGGQQIHPYDKIEEWLIDGPLHLLKIFLSKFSFLQNGNLQFYILYGMVFITLVLGIPYVFEYLHSLIQFLNTL